MCITRECEKGCTCFSGGEVKHNPHCVHYPESRTKMYDDLKAKLEQLERMYHARGRRIDAMEHELTTHHGLWAIDRDPKDVDIEWIRRNAFPLKKDVRNG